MLLELTPKHVIVYGPYNKNIFEQYEHQVHFHHLPDWTTHVHEKEKVN